MITVEIELRGHAFSIGMEPFRQALENSVRDLTELGHQRLELMLVPRPAGVYLTVTPAGAPWGGPGTSRPGRGSTGHYRRSLHRQVSGLHGVIDDSNVVYGPWLENGSAATRFRGYASFRRVGDWMNAQAPTVLRHNIEQALREIN